MKPKLRNVTLLAQNSIDDWFDFKYENIKNTYLSIHPFQRGIFIYELARDIKDYTNSIDHTTSDIEKIIKEKLGVK